ncbi:enediyne biosynthesis protein UnbU [Lentzea sp. NPDC058450]|uniref:enediyne biosynthesis protein UnbU n=1 Tax=Lentzea sp. NPDC058450 TaxID=3346505 RepID=UPI00365F68ED
MTTTPADTTRPSPSHRLAARPPDKRLMALRRFAMSITAFNVIGHLVLGFEQSPITPIVTVLVAYSVDLLLETLDARAHGRTPGYRGGPMKLMNFLLPSHIGGLAVAMLLYGNTSLWPYIFAVTAGVSTKYLLRLRVKGKKRHFLNPSNAGIALTLVLFPWVGIAPPYHFTNEPTGAIDWILPLAILGAGTMINAKLTGKLPLIMGWVGGFALQAFLRWAIFDHAFLAALLPMTGLAFVIFTNYMITDPGSTPVSKRNQALFGVATAFTYGILVLNGVVFGFFFALVIVCILRGGVLVVSELRNRNEERVALAGVDGR